MPDIRLGLQGWQCTDCRRYCAALTRSAKPCGHCDPAEMLALGNAVQRQHPLVAMRREGW